MSRALWGYKRERHVTVRSGLAGFVPIACTQNHPHNKQKKNNCLLAQAAVMAEGLSRVRSVTSCVKCRIKQKHLFDCAYSDCVIIRFAKSDLKSDLEIPKCKSHVFNIFQTKKNDCFIFCSQAHRAHRGPLGPIGAHWPIGPPWGPNFGLSPHLATLAKQGEN